MARQDLSERHRQQRRKNYALLAVLVGFCLVFYLVFLVRAGLL